ncbi:MAG: DUF362 domain-containing protein [Desulfobacteraceae bacterium]|nr:DUF362 domain-containing protein [Desulfobacteraceae bacterium]
MFKEMAEKLKLPRMRMVEQSYEVPPSVDVRAEVDREWDLVKDTVNLPAGSKVAVGVGSRGVSNLAETVRAVVEKLKGVGYEPFITPAMGSHGGASVEGQIGVLRHRGVTEESVGAPIRATMEVVSMGEVDGIPLFLDRLAHEADGIVPINRIKPHTNFIGSWESGVLKMMAIGLGNQMGAEHYHRLSLVKDLYTVIISAGRELLKRSKVLFGVGLVENQEHETVSVRMGAPDAWEPLEAELLKWARALVPGLLLKEIDLLVIDEMGKEISGEGIDPNVVGRDCLTYGAKREWPKVTRIFVRDLTEATEGSAVGIGQADFTTQRLVDKIDFEATAINCLTACAPEGAFLPITFETDREALAVAMMTLRPCTLEDVRIVHMRNTLDPKRLLVSEGCLSFLKDRTDVKIDEEDLALEFDRAGNIVSRLM